MCMYAFSLFFIDYIIFIGVYLFRKYLTKQKQKHEFSIMYSSGSSDECKQYHEIWIDRFENL